MRFALTSEFLAVDGLSTSAVALGEVTTLKHELGDDTVEGGTLVSVAMFASSKLAEVLGSLGDNIVAQREDNSSGGLAVNGDIELEFQGKRRGTSQNRVNWTIFEALVRQKGRTKTLDMVVLVCFRRDG